MPPKKDNKSSGGGGKDKGGKAGGNDEKGKFKTGVFIYYLKKKGFFWKFKKIPC